MNSMIDHLVSIQNNLARTNRRLEALNRIASAANLEADIHDVLYQIITGILDVMGLETGWIYLYGPDREQFHLASWHGVPDDMKETLLHNPGDERCECQRDLISGTLGTKPIIRQCQKLKNKHPDRSQTSHITLKIEARERIFGIVNLQCSEGYEASEEDLEMLTALGSQISEIVANAWLRLKLVEKESARQVLLASLVKAQEEEQSRLSRELHDGTGQTLTSLLVRLKTLEKKTTSESQRRELIVLCDRVSEAIEDVRVLSRQLRPAALEEFGLEVAIQTMLTDMTEDKDLVAELHSNLEDMHLSYEIESTLYRIAQESLTNTIRHARAKQITIGVTLLPNAVSLEIEDDGIGFDVNSDHYRDGRHRLGLLSMQERLDIIGGSLSVFTAPGNGTRILAQIPLSDEVNR